MTQFDFKKLVDAEYLLNNRTNNNVVVIDARGGMLEEGSLMYDKAIVVDWTDISLLGEFGGEELGKLLSKENYQQIFSKLGIIDESEVLVYGFTMPEQGFGISLPFNSLVDSNGFLKSRAALEKYVTDKGLDKNKLQITYCTTGVRASYVAVVLEELGFKVRNYEPSFARYANVGEVVLD